MPRYTLSRHERVTDIGSREEVGKVINLSTAGFMLVGPQPVEVHKFLYLLLELSTLTETKCRIRLEAQCLWCGPSSYSDDYGAGFEITYIAPTEQRKLQQWIDQAATPAHQPQRQATLARDLQPLPCFQASASVKQAAWPSS